MLYSGNREIPMAIERIRELLLWGEGPPVTRACFEELERGTFYVMGRDRQCRPNIVLNLTSFKKEIGQEVYLPALNYLMRNIQKHAFLPSRVESWNFIIDVRNSGLLSMELSMIKEVIGKLSRLFPGTLNKMYILNPSFLARTLWACAKMVIHPETLAKIHLLSEEDFPEMFAFIDPAELEVRYGGTKPNLVVFWPPSINPPEPETKTATFQQSEPQDEWEDANMVPRLSLNSGDLISEADSFRTIVNNFSLATESTEHRPQPPYFPLKE
jgi:hypothetical protein